MVKSTPTATLQQTMEAEAQAIRQFVELLKLEQSSLSSGNTDALSEYAQQKVKFADQLNTLAAQRNASLAEQGFGPDRTGVDAWCAAHPADSSTARAWSDTLALATEARALNHLNGKLIQIRMRYNAKALEALRGTNDSLDLYGPDGQSRTAGPGRINHSV